MICLADSPFVFCDLPRLYLRPPGKGQAAPGPVREVRVRGARVHADTAILGLDGVVDRDQAEALRGLEILAVRGDMPDYDPDDIYFKDILGSAVFTGESWDAASPLGTLAGLLEAPAQEIWVIHTPAGQEVLFPAAPEFTRDLDVSGKRILIAPPPGLLELYLGEPDDSPPEKQN